MCMLNEKEMKKMKVQVYFQDRKNENKFVNMATIDCGDRDIDAALEYAYFRTQNIDGSWSKPYVFDFKGEEIINSDYSEDITVVAPLMVRDGIEYGHRSSMMGDRFYTDEGVYEVDAIGFKFIPDMDESNVVEEEDADELAAIGLEIIKQAATKKITPAKKGSKKAVVASIIAEIGLDDRKTLVERIMTALNVTKANAGVYIYNYKKSLEA